MVDERTPDVRNDRYQWHSRPEALRNAFEREVGAGVVQATTQPGGFTSGVAAVLDLEGGSQCFVKAVPNSDVMASGYRHEVLISSQLPPSVPAPRLRFSSDDFGWVLLCFDAIDGRLPTLPWRDDELAAALTAIATTADALTPTPIAGIETIKQSAAEEFMCWRNLASDGTTFETLNVAWLQPGLRKQVNRLAEMESRWQEATVGNTLIHFDLRADNMIIDDAGKVWFVDWSWPAVGAQWIDLLTFLPTTHRAPTYLEAVVREHPVSRHVAPADIDAYLAALAGLWLQRSMAPPLANAPHLRSHQAAAARSTLEWLAARGLDVAIDDGPLAVQPAG